MAPLSRAVTALIGEKPFPLTLTLGFEAEKSIKARRAVSLCHRQKKRKAKGAHHKLIAQPTAHTFVQGIKKNEKKKERRKMKKSDPPKFNNDL